MLEHKLSASALWLKHKCEQLRTYKVYPASTVVTEADSGFSRDDFHKCMKSMNMGIPEPVLDELISFVDTDNCGYVEMPEFVELMNPLNDENLPRHG